MGGIVLPTDGDADQVEYGTIVKSGTPKIGVAWYKDGQTIVYSKFSGMTIRLEGVLHKIITFDDVLLSFPTTQDSVEQTTKQ